MPYKVLNTFNDLEHQTTYEKGDPYPKDGFEERPERVKELQGIHKKYKRAFLAAEELGSDKDLEKDKQEGDPEEVSVDISSLSREQLKDEVTAAKIKEYLDSKDIEYKSSANKDTLIDLVLESE
jgi:hypothetical protein